MKFALQRADPVVFNVQRTWLAVVVLFAVLFWQRRPLLPDVVARGHRDRLLPDDDQFRRRRRWRSPAAAPAARRCSCSRCRSGRCCIAWPVLHERVQGQPVARGRAARSRGSCSSSSHGTGTATSRPKLWAVLSGFGWAAGTVATKYFQRGRIASTRSTSSRGRCSSACCRSRCCRSLFGAAARRNGA